MKLEVRDLSCGYGSRVVLAGLSMSVGEGEGMCLLGPNGVGKTTILRTILGLQPLLAGAVLLDGKDIRTWSPKQLAREVAYVPQVHHAPFPYCVLDVVTMGRTPHLQGYSSPSAKDTIIAEEALDALGLTHLADQPYTEISGGERQMVLIARAVAQRARLLILDEPTSNLDLGNQVRVLKQIRKMIGEGIAVVVNSTCQATRGCARPRLPCSLAGEGGGSARSAKCSARSGSPRPTASRSASPASQGPGAEKSSPACPSSSPIDRAPQSHCRALRSISHTKNGPPIREVRIPRGTSVVVRLRARSSTSTSTPPPTRREVGRRMR